MPKPNFSFEKRRRELEKKAKKEAKKLRRLEGVTEAQVKNINEAKPVEDK